MVSILGEKSQRLGQMTGHNGAELVERLLLGRVPYFQGNPMFLGQRVNLGENPADSPLLHLDQAAADVETADAPQGALFVQGDIGGTAANVDVGHCGAVFLGNHIGPGASGRQNTLQVRACRGHYEVSGHIGQRFQNLIGILLAGCVAGDDDRAGL